MLLIQELVKESREGPSFKPTQEETKILLSVSRNKSRTFCFLKRNPAFGFKLFFFLNVAIIFLVPYQPLNNNTVKFRIQSCVKHWYPFVYWGYQMLVTKCTLK